MKELSAIAENVQASTTLAMDSLYKEMKAAGIDVLGFAAGEPDFPTPDYIKYAGIEAIVNNDTRYTPATGTLDLKKAVCYRLKEDLGLDYEPANIVCTAARSTACTRRCGPSSTPATRSSSPCPPGSATTRWSRWWAVCPSTSTATRTRTSR